jgi:hypothetical protein
MILRSKNTLKKHIMKQITCIEDIIKFTLQTP